MIGKELIQSVKQLRVRLHANPELALKEDTTRNILKEFIRKESGLEIHDRDSCFYVSVGETIDRAPIAFRADIDAVCGSNGKAGHYCGHDGHAATLAGFAVYLSKIRVNRPIYLIFQPAEETGQGGHLCAELVKEKGIARVYAYHNIPGYKKNSILIREGTFACASTGLEITVTGSPSHAAYPEFGKNPSTAIAEIILYMNSRIAAPAKGMILGTVIGAEIGSCAYGVSAGNGVLRLTLRGEYQEDFERLVNDITDYAKNVCARDGLKADIREIERFPASQNALECVETLRSAMQEAGLSVIELESPFRWSEDFGHYGKTAKTAIFGIGDGEDYPQLHTDGFEYPDDILETALKAFEAILIRENQWNKGTM